MSSQTPQDGQEGKSDFWCWCMWGGGSDQWILHQMLFTSEDDRQTFASMPGFRMSIIYVPLLKMIQT
jgi:hypothetical protein